MIKNGVGTLKSWRFCRTHSIPLWSCILRIFMPVHLYISISSLTYINNAVTPSVFWEMSSFFPTGQFLERYTELIGSAREVISDDQRRFNVHRKGNNSQKFSGAAPTPHLHTHPPPRSLWRDHKEPVTPQLGPPPGTNHHPIGRTVTLSPLVESPR